jgi:hypothetical protein
MGLLSALRDRLFGQPATTSVGTDVLADSDASASEAMPKRQPDQIPESEPGSDDAVAARQERLASRILEDERLRGDLTDEEFQPLLDWALAAADRLAASTAGLPDERADQRMDHALSAIRESVAAAADAIAAYAERDVDRLRRALADAGLGARHQRTDGAIARLMIERDLPGPEVASLIASRLGEVTVDASSHPRKASS